MKPRASTGGLVYSTDSGRMCPVCRQPVAQCQCSAAKPPAAGDGIVRVSRETKGRAGKGVTSQSLVTTIEARVEQQGALAVPAKNLLETVGEIPSGTITIAVADYHLRITCDSDGPSMYSITRK